MKDLGAIMKQAQEMQAKLQSAQAKLAETVIEGTSGGGMVRLTLKGTGEMTGVTIDESLLAPGEATMQGIINWIRTHPAEGTAIMRENRSWVFFKELTGAGPLGALGLPLTPGGSVAVDPAYVPLGAPVLLSMDRADADGIWIAQDTGGAIKGSNRFDTFWGAGANARATAGG